mgnify:CR=1 FL=1
MFSLAHAQQTKISGKITDNKTGEELIGVNVVLNDTTGVATDDKGNYFFDVNPGKHKLIFSYIGYSDEKRKVELNLGEQKQLDIKMAPSTTNLDMVVVSAGRFEQDVKELTVSVDLIKSDLLETKNVTNIERAIAEAPGVHIIDGQANIRGGSGWSYGAGSRVMVMQDGVPLTNGVAGSVQWELVAAENVEQIEVIKGASSVLYGSSALNGAINIITARPGNIPETKLTMFRGVYDLPKRKEIAWWKDQYLPIGTQGFSFSHAERLGNLDLTVGLHHVNNEGFIQGIIDRRNRAFIKTEYYSKKKEGLSYGLNVNLLSSLAGESFLYESDARGYQSYGGEVYNIETEQLNLLPHISYQRPGSDIKHQWKGQFLRINYVDSITYFSNSYFSDYQIQKQKKDNYTWTSGITGNFVRGFAPTFIGSHNSLNASLYTQWDKTLNRFHFSVGGRYEYYNLNGEERRKPILRSGVNYELNKKTFLRASFGQSYRFPAMAELFIQRDAGEISFYPNTDLRPESGWSAEIGIKKNVKISNWNAYVDLAAFVMEYDDMMEFSFGLWGDSTRLNPLGVGFKSINVGATQISGAELSFTGQGSIGKWDLQLMGSYTYINPISLTPNKAYGSYADRLEPLVDQILNDPELAPLENIIRDLLDQQSTLTYSSTSSDNSGDVLKYRYRHLFKIDLSARYKKIEPSFSLRYNSFMENVDQLFESGALNQEVSDLFTLAGTQIADMGIKESREDKKNGDLIIDVRFGYHLNDNAKVSFIIDNLLNTEYQPRPAGIAAPRSYTLQFSLNL